MCIRQMCQLYVHMTEIKPTPLLSNSERKWVCSPDSKTEEGVASENMLEFLLFPSVHVCVCRMETIMETPNLLSPVRCVCVCLCVYVYVFLVCSQTHRSTAH